MAPPQHQRQRLVRRTPLVQRIKAYLDPWDFLLWLSEELNGNDWEDALEPWATPLAISFNLVFMIARANTRSSSKADDDIFGDRHRGFGSGWFLWICSLIVFSLSSISIANAIYTFSRKRNYRLFEASVDTVPSTPSARRVRVDSSPSTSTPVRLISSIIGQVGDNANSRAHPDPTRDVWELAVWDPTPLCLRLFTLFSPGHIAIYYLFLPLTSLDPRPSVTVFTTIILAALFSLQLSLLLSFFTQQAKDSALVHKEVQNEYDTKFVHPITRRPVRDVGTQYLQKRASTSTPGSGFKEVLTFTPTTYVNRGFQTHPNPAYAQHYDPDQSVPQSARSQRSVTTPAQFPRRANKMNNLVSSPLSGRTPSVQNLR